MTGIEEREIVRFQRHVAFGNMFECWEWTGARTGGNQRDYNRHGGKPYGVFYFRRRAFYAHRFAAAIAKGIHPLLLTFHDVVMHRCDNPSCVNPAHLEIATQLENVRDAHRKGRARNGAMSPTCEGVPF